jgi:hypothetical protein
MYNSGAYHDAPEVITEPQVVIPMTPMSQYSDPGKIAVPSSAPLMVAEAEAGLPPKYEGSAGGAGGAGNRICGLKRRTFLIVAAIAVAVMIAAVAGGVAGEMAASRNSAAADRWVILNSWWYGS